ncbi:MAG: hypothetical protein RL722_186 [Pseudomonadota bacterium]|jgi:CheY-like chemotaxis protein
MGKQQHTVAMLGFSAFERSTLETCFRLSLERTQAYVLASSIEGSELLIADCDQPEVVRTVTNAGRLHDTVFVGQRQPQGSAGAHLPRPIDALAVQRTLDALLARRAIDTWPVALERRRARRSDGRLRRWTGQARRVLDFVNSAGFSNSVTSGEDRQRHVLVVSPSPAEQQLLCGALEPLGYKPVCCTSGSNARQLAAQTPFLFVFLGMAMGPGSAYQTCREIKAAPQEDKVLPLLGRQAQPAVVMMARAGSAATERARATVAGCDAFLTEPIDEEELKDILARHDSAFERGFEPTAMQAAAA